MISAEQQRVAWREMWHHAIIGIAIVGENGKFEAANPAFCNITEYTEAELQSLTFQDITHPADVDADVTMSRRVSSGHENMYNMKKRYITKTGRVVWVVLRVRPIRREDGGFDFFLSQISELVELQPPKLPGQYPSSKELRMSEDRLSHYIKKYWPLIFIVATSLGIFVGEAIKRTLE